MKSNPLVSILINNYNYERFLSDAINSALKQTYQNIEIIVVDDGSTDKSLEIIQNYRNEIIPIPKKNGGQASAFNAGFAHSQGEIICFLDADDTFTPEKIAKIVNIFQNHEQVGWCFHPLKFVNGDLSDSLHPQASYTGESGVYEIRPTIQRGKLRGTLPFAGTATSGLCFRRSLLQQILPMPESIRITSDDYLKYSAFGRGQGFVLLEKLAWQRIHGDNAYTFRPDKQALRASIEILTAYWLRKNTPDLAKFANNIFAQGLSKYRSLKSKNADCQKNVEEYLSLLTLTEKLNINLRILYYRLCW